MDIKLEVCKHDEYCGGCIYQGKEYGEQLAIKEGQVKEYIRENELVVESLDSIEPTPARYRYRNKMDYTFGDLVKDGEMTLGMHQKGRFMSIVTVDECQLVPEDFNKILRATLDFCLEKGYTKYHKRTHEGMMRNLVLRRGVRTGQILINIVTQSDRDEGSFDEEGYLRMILSLDLEDEVCGVLRTINDDWSDAVKCDELRVLYGQDYYMERIMDLDFKVSAFSFFQTNVEAVERLYKEAISLIDDVSGKTVFDLFCGTGTITQALARSAQNAIGVEIVEDAVISARQNAELNGLDNCEFIAGDVLKVLPELEEKPDVIVVDPPRAGIHPKVLPMIASYGVDEILYISCNPKTMCKDLKVLQDSGYRIKYMKPFDNFAFTKHVETVVLMSKENT